MSGSDTVTLRSGVRYSRKLCEGWLEHKCHRATGSQYVRLWLVLKGNILYIFNNSDTAQENQIGSLTIDNQTTFTPEGGDRNKGFKFDLTTRAKKNRFKSKKLAERELWRGYIMGVAKGTVPEDLDLLEDQVNKIKADIAALSTDQWQDMGGNRSSMASGGSGDSGVETTSFASGFSSSHTLIGSDSSGGGPTMNDKFYADHRSSSVDQTTPSWFFSGCSREKAEDILTKCSTHGNTLMRESTSHMKSGSYVISKRVLDKVSNKYMFEHYEVMRVAGGYKLNVQNEHNPMRCLTDVMEYFRETAGGSTRLMDTNDPFRTGTANDPEYQRHIRRSMDPDPWSWPPPDSSSDDDYEDPIDPEALPPPGKYPGGGTSTVSPGILGAPRGSNQKKSVQFHPRNTYAGPSHRAKSETTMSDIVHRSHAAEHLRQFDAMIDSFERDHVYQNDEPMNNPEIATSPTVSTSRTTMPLPPTPHQAPEPSHHSYVDEDHTDHTLESLPVAPPPPRSPAGQENRNTISLVPVPPPLPPLPPLSTMVTPSGPVQTPVQLPVSKASTPLKPAPNPVSSGSTDIGKTPSISNSKTVSAGPSQHSPLNHVSSSPGLTLQESVAQKRAQLKKVNSEGSGLSSKVNPKFPDTMPTWNQQPKSSVGALKLSNSVAPAQKTNHTEEVTSGVDESNPGGVQNLSRMFEQSAQVTLRKGGSSHKPQQTGNDVRNRASQAGIRDVKLSQNADAFTPPTVESLSRRRQTDPGPLKMQEVEYENRFNESFKRKLEGFLSSPLSPGTNRHVEHEYEELPIKPDAVTYANDLEN